MDIAALQAELRATHYQGRVDRMIALGKDARTDPRARALIQELSRGNPFDRRMALYACYTLRDSVLVTRGTTDDSRIVRNLAFSLVALCCSDDDAFATSSPSVACTTACGPAEHHAASSASCAGSLAR